MNLFKKLKKGISVLLVASMLVGMAVDAPTSKAAEGDSSNTATSESTAGSNESAPASTPDNTDTDEQTPAATSVPDNHISQSTDFTLFEDENKVTTGSKLKVSVEESEGYPYHYDTRVLSNDGKAEDDYFDLSVVVNGSYYYDKFENPTNVPDWSSAYEDNVNNFTSHINGTNVLSTFCPSPTPAPDENASNKELELVDVSQVMLNASDYATYKDTALATELQKPYWLGSRVVGKNGTEYSAVAYVYEETSGNEKLDIGSIRSNLAYVYFKAKANKVKYICLDDVVDNATDAWKNDLSSPSGTPCYRAFYEDDTNNGFIKLKDWKGNQITPPTAPEVPSTIVADTEMTVEVPVDADKLLCTLCNEAGNAVSYRVVDLGNLPEITAGPGVDNHKEKKVSVPNIIGQGFLKLIAYTNEGLIKAEQEYQVNIEPKRDLDIKFRNEEYSNNLELMYTDTDATTTESSSVVASATGTINLKVTESNWYVNPSDIDDFYLLTDDDKDNCAVNGEDVTTANTLRISSYDPTCGTLTINADTNFTKGEIESYAGEKNVYLYCKNNGKYKMVGSVNINRKYTSTYSYDNNKNKYEYGQFNATENGMAIDDNTQANTGLDMSLAEGSFKGISNLVLDTTLSSEKKVKFVTPEGTTIENDDTNNNILDWCAYITRRQVDNNNITQFVYTPLVEGAASTNVQLVKDAGTYKTQSENVEFYVYLDNDDICISNVEPGQNDILFTFTANNIGERQFTVAPRPITLKTKDQSINDTGELSSDSSKVTTTYNGSETGTVSALVYSDSLTVNLEKAGNRDIIFKNIEGYGKEYKITRAGETGEDVTHNYDVTLSNVYGKLTTTRLTAKLYKESFDTENVFKDTDVNENRIPTYTLTYDGSPHKVYVHPRTITDAESPESDDAPSPDVKYRWKNIAESPASNEDGYSDKSYTIPEFTEAGEYLVEYTVSSAEFKDYVKTYYVKIKQKPITVTISDQTYQYANTGVNRYFKQFDPESNSTISLVTADDLVEDHKISAIELVPELTAGEKDSSGNYITGTGEIIALNNKVTIKAADKTDKTDNYTITIEPGTLTVEKATLNVTNLNSFNKTYDGISNIAKGKYYPSISAQYNAKDSSINDANATVHYYQVAQGTVTGDSAHDKSKFTLTKPDLTNAGNTTVYYYASAEGYNDSEIKSFGVNIAKRNITISAKDQTVTYPDKITTEFAATDYTTYVDVDNLVSGHTVSGNIDMTKTENSEPDCYEQGTLSIGKTSDTEDTLDVAVWSGEENVTKNYNITEGGTVAAYTINKNEFTDEQVKAEGYSAVYDSSAHDAITVTLPEEFDTNKDKIYYSLSKADEGTAAQNDEATDSAGEEQWSEDIPKIIAAGEYVVSYKIVKEGYKDYVSNVNAVISKAPLNLVVQSQTASISDIVLDAQVGGVNEPADYVTPYGLKGEDAINSVTFYSAKLESIEDDNIDGAELDVKKNSDGKYCISITNGDKDVTSNYAITTITGLLTIKKGTFDVTAEPKDVTYDGKLHNIYDLIGFKVNGKTVSEAEGAYYNFDIKVSEDGSTYTSAKEYVMTEPATKNLYYKVTAKGYNDYYSAGTVSAVIKKKVLTLTVADQSVSYGTPFNPNGYEITGDFVEGHVMDVSNFKLYVDDFEGGADTGNTVIKNNGKIKVMYGNEDVTACYELKQKEEAIYTVSALSFDDSDLKIVVDGNSDYLDLGDISNFSYTADYHNVEVAYREAGNVPEGYKVTYTVNDVSADKLSFINAGTYKVEAIVSAKGYTPKTVSFNFVLKPQKVRIRLANQTINYGDSIKQPDGAVRNIAADSVNNDIFAYVTGIQGNDSIVIDSIETDVEDATKLTFDASKVTVNYDKNVCTGNKNYTITEVEKATLTINNRPINVSVIPQNIKDGDTRYDAAANTFTVNGSENAAKCLKITGDTQLCKGDYIDSIVFNVGAEDTDSSDEYTHKYALSIASMVIKNSKGTDVTEHYTHNDTNAAISVESIPVIISGKTVTYDGQPHVADCSVADGYSFNIDDATIEYRTVAESDTAGEITTGITDVTSATKLHVTVKADGYNDKTGIVSITVNQCPLMITAMSQNDVELGGNILQVGDDTANGGKAVALTVGETAGANDVVVARIGKLVDGHNLAGISLNADTAAMGNQAIVVDISNITITDAAGNVVTSNYKISTANGSVYVKPMELSISVNGVAPKDITSAYNGTSPLDTVTTSPNDATLTYTVNGVSKSTIDEVKASTIAAGEYMVTIKATKENCTPAQNTFKITVKPADVAVTPVRITVNDDAKDKAFAVPFDNGGTNDCKLDMSITSADRDVSGEYSVTYSLTENGTYSDTFTLTVAGQNTVYYKATTNSNNYAQKEISGSVNITYCDHTDADTTFKKVADEVNAYTCNTCGEKITYSYNVNAYVATTMSGTDFIKVASVKDIPLVNSSYAPNTSVELKSKPHKTSTNVFLGWYKLSDIVDAPTVDNTSTDKVINVKALTSLPVPMNWTYTASLDKNNLTEEYVAVFKENIETRTFTVIAGEGGTVQYGDLVSSEANDTITKDDIKLGDSVTVKANADETHKFVYWTNESGSVLSSEAEYTFTLTVNTTVKAVFAENGKVTVNTYTKFGQSINTESFTAGTTDNIEVTIVDYPVVIDYAFIGWKLELVKDNVINTEVSKEYKLKNSIENVPQPVDDNGYEDIDTLVAALKTAIVGIVADGNNQGSEVKLTPLYQKETKPEFEVKVINGTITNSGEYEVTDIENGQSISPTEKTYITVKANEAPENQKFECWKVGDKAVSYNETYSFYVSEAITVTANYVADEQVVEVKATTDITKFVKTPGTSINKLTFTSTSTVPEGCTIEKGGMKIWLFSKEQDNDDWMSTTPTRDKGLSSTSTTYNYTYSFSVYNTSEYYVYIQAYVTYVNENGERFTEKGDYYKVHVAAGEAAITNDDIVNISKSASSAE